MTRAEALDLVGVVASGVASLIAFVAVVLIGLAVLGQVRR